MGQLEDILKHQNMVRNNIMKSFGVENSEDSLEKGFEDEINPFEMEAYKSELTKAELDEFEKAKHQDGDMHPNGKWVWRQSANGGKGDWRVAKPSKGGRRANAAQSSANNNQQPTNQPSVSSSSSAAKQSSSKTTSSNSGLSDSKKQSVGKTPDTMVEIHKELDNKFGQENEPFTYTSNGVDDLKKNGKKGYATWVGFEHAVRGRQPVDKNKMRNFISNTAVDQFLSVVNEKSGKKYTSKDVKIEDRWDSTDMYRLYIEVDNSDDNSNASTKKIGKTDEAEIKSMISWMKGKNGSNWTQADATKAVEFLSKVPSKYKSNDRNVINKINKTLNNLYVEINKNK
jgi:hypothetical protein